MKNMNSNLCFRGRVAFYLNDVCIDRTSNMIVNTGYHWVMRQLAGNSNPISHMALGKGTAEPALNNTLWLTSYIAVQ